MSRYILRMNRTSVWKVMTILIFRELPLFNFERLDIWCAWIGPPCEKLCPFEFLLSFRCSISSVLTCDVPESDLRVQSYDHFNFSSTSVVQFRASRQVMCLNRTSVCKVMTILISRELPLFNIERLDILCAWIGHPSEKLWPFQFLEGFRCSISSVSIYYALESDLRVKSYDHLNFCRAYVVQFQASRHGMCLNRTSVWKVITIWISRQLALFNFERLDLWCAWIGPLCVKLWPFKFLESFSCSISSVSIYYALESDIRVKIYEHLNFSRAAVVQFRASRHVMCLNWTSEWKFMTIWNSREQTLFNNQCLNIFCAWIGHPYEKLWPF